MEDQQHQPLLPNNRPAPLPLPPKTTEELIDIKREISRLVARKRQMDQHLVDLEGRIYVVESAYFRSTSSFGSLLSGLYGYLGLPNPTALNSGGGSSIPHVAAAATPSTLRKSVGRREPIRDEDRLFSNTSSSFRKSVAIYYRQNEPPAAGNSDDESLASRKSRSRRRSVDPAWSSTTKRLRQQ